jgi:Mg2+ and Co2+ transporter CorA
VDPTVTAGHPIWGGYSSFAQWTVEAADKGEPSPPRTSLHKDVVYWMLQLGDQDVSNMIENPKACAVPLLWLILSDIQHVIQYITAQLGQIEWEIALPSMRSNPKVDSTMDKLHPWRRNVTLYRAMISHAIDRIFTKEMKVQADEKDETRGVASLYKDFQIILNDIDTIQHRIERIVSVATALQSIEESRSAMVQTRNVARLTYLATVFIPLSFVSGFLSMVPDVSKITQTIWIFFTIAVPLTAITLLIVDFLQLRTKLEDAFLSRRKRKDKVKKKTT